MMSAGWKQHRGKKISLNGWIRLGIVLSASWLVVVAYLAYEDISEVSKTKKFEISKDGAGAVTIVFPAARTDFDIERDIQENWIPQLEANPSAYRGPPITRPYDRYLRIHLQPRKVKYAKLAFLPIMGLFALGWSAAWVWRGFLQP